MSAMVTIESFRGLVDNAMPHELDGIYRDACSAMMRNFLKPSEVDEIENLIAGRRLLPQQLEVKAKKSTKVDTRQKSLFGGME